MIENALGTSYRKLNSTNFWNAIEHSDYTPLSAPVFQNILNTGAARLEAAASATAGFCPFPPCGYTSPPAQASMYASANASASITGSVSAGGLTGNFIFTEEDTWTENFNGGPTTSGILTNHGTYWEWFLDFDFITVGAYITTTGAGGIQATGANRERMYYNFNLEVSGSYTSNIFNLHSTTSNNSTFDDFNNIFSTGSGLGDGWSYVERHGFSSRSGSADRLGPDENYFHINKVESSDTTYYIRKMRLEEIGYCDLLDSDRYETGYNYGNSNFSGLHDGSEGTHDVWYVSGTSGAIFTTTGDTGTQDRVGTGLVPIALPDTNYYYRFEVSGMSNSDIELVGVDNPLTSIQTYSINQTVTALANNWYLYENTFTTPSSGTMGNNHHLVFYTTGFNEPINVRGQYIVRRNNY